MNYNLGTFLEFDKVKLILDTVNGYSDGKDRSKSICGISGNSVVVQHCYCFDFQREKNKIRISECENCTCRIKKKWPAQNTKSLIRHYALDFQKKLIPGCWHQDL